MVKELTLAQKSDFFLKLLTPREKSFLMCLPLKGPQLFCYAKAYICAISGIDFDKLTLEMVAAYIYLNIPAQQWQPIREDRTARKPLSQSVARMLNMYDPQINLNLTLLGRSITLALKNIRINLPKQENGSLYANINLTLAQKCGLDTQTIVELVDRLENSQES